MLSLAMDMVGNGCTLVWVSDKAKKSEDRCMLLLEIPSVTVYVPMTTWQEKL